MDLLAFVLIVAWIFNKSTARSFAEAVHAYRQRLRELEASE